MSTKFKFQSSSARNKVRYSKAGRKQLYFKKKNSQNIDDEISSLNERSRTIESSKIKSFEDFPLSGKTQKGLKAHKYNVPTDIQRESIGLALQGQDILGAAKTGSGKTLAFIIPVLECLYKNKWSQLDGLGALIISPTRELAYQTFEVLRKVGKFHDFSAGLVIGGKPLMEEAGRINRTNIVICTPGRLLQHMDETSYFTADSLKILVLDEADRILDMGFAQTMNGIIENLPPERQTLLFSATQTRSVKDLARLSLTEPVFVSVHEHASQSTPVQLQQSYVVCELHEKLNLLWSFLKNHQKSKILVFLASCKEVKYVYEAFKKLHPGIPVIALHGSMPQLKRVAVYNQFIWKQNAVLFATDIAARGLDFPSVNWVIQLDCPEDASTYIHRVGRTARYEKDGEALLVLTPSEEEGMTEQLKARKIPISKIQINQKRLLSIQGKLESNCAAYPELKETAQKAFVSYLRSVFLMGNKKVFNVQALDTEEFSRSLGLAIPPKVRFLKKHQKEMELRAEKAKLKQNSENKNVKTDSAKAMHSQMEDSYSNTDSDLDPVFEQNENEHLTKSVKLKSKKQMELQKHLEDKIDSDGSEENSSDESESENTLTRTDDGNVVGNKSGSENSEDLSDSESEIDDDKNVNKVDTNDSEYLSKVKGKVKQTGNKKIGIDEKSAGDSKGVKHKVNAKTSESESGTENTDESDIELNQDIEMVSQKGFRFDVDDDQELFSVKRNVNLKEFDKEDEATEPASSQQKQKKSRTVTKYALAKKLQRKKLQVNTKVSFDEEGEVKVDRLKAPVVAIDTERSDQFGGIDIERAKLRMRQEDTVDREIYRQKIKQKHREERLKRKEENRQRKQREVEDEAEAVLDHTGDDSDADPLAYLPDPDQIYGPSQTSGDEEFHYDSSQAFDDSDDEGVSPKKRQKKTSNKAKKKLKTGKQKQTESLENLSYTNNSLADDEDLALRLLNK